MTAQNKILFRQIILIILILICIPLTIFIGIKFFDDRKYMFISTLILLECSLPFFMIFESRLPKTREIMIIAVLTAIGVAGRVAFFWLPQFKPMVAVTIISGIALGGEAGFLVGALIAFTSNFYFGQGPWTPWQMFSTGIIGFLSSIVFSRLGNKKSNKFLILSYIISSIIFYGILRWLLFQFLPKTIYGNKIFISMTKIAILLLSIFFAKKLIDFSKKKEKKLQLAVYGFIVTFFIYGGIMDPASVITFSAQLNKEAIMAAYISGIPFNLVHAVSSFVFLYFFGEIMLEKIERIKIKFGINKD